MERMNDVRRLRAEMAEELERLRVEEWNRFVAGIDGERSDKDFWTSVKRVYGGNGTKQVKYLRNHNNEEIHTKEGKETIFRGHWSKTFQITEDENSQFDEQNELHVNTTINNSQNILNPPFPSIDNSITITPTEITDLIKTFKQKAPGPDKITKAHLKNLPASMITHLATIATATIKIGYFPTKWKASTMIFIPKPNKSPYEHSNYRPISLLNVPSKILEKAINKRLIESIDAKNLNNINQHGFRLGRGTDTATAITYETIAASKAQKLKTNVILRDIKGAFDKVWHNGIIYKLIVNNFHPTIIRIIASYLNNRTTTIRIDDYTGQPFNINCGVPQGGCLSPTVFNFYTHDLPQPISYNTENIIYADDVTQIVSHRSEKYLTRLSQREIEQISSFENKWKINTNIKKFQVIPLEEKRTNKIIINNEEIDYHQSGVALGVTITRTGFSAHTTNRINKTKFTISKLFSLRNLNQSNKRKLYLALTRAKLIYPTIPIHTRSNTQMHKLQIIQNKAARIIANIRKSDHITSQEANNRANLIPLNLILHESAKTIWQKIELTENQENKLNYFPRENHLYPSSRKKCSTAIEPIY